jgi:hypothetical protein
LLGVDFTACKLSLTACWLLRIAVVLGEHLLAERFRMIARPHGEWCWPFEFEAFEQQCAACSI